jgi:hypothetical protein
MGHISNNDLDLTGTQVYGSHGSMAMFNGIDDLLVNVTLPETGVPEIRGGRVEKGCDRTFAVAIGSMTRGALFLIKGFSLSGFSHRWAYGCEERQPHEYTDYDVYKGLIHKMSSIMTQSHRLSSSTANLPISPSVPLIL